MKEVLFRQEYGFGRILVIIHRKTVKSSDLLQAFIETADWAPLSQLCDESTVFEFDFRTEDACTVVMWNRFPILKIAIWFDCVTKAETHYSKTKKKKKHCFESVTIPVWFASVNIFFNIPKISICEITFDIIYSRPGAQRALHFGGGNFHEISFDDVIVLIQPWYNLFANGHV